MEDDGLPIFPVPIGTSLKVVPVVPHLSDEPDVTFAGLLEQEDPASLGLVIAKRPVRPHKLHVTDLPLARVPEHAIGLEPVLISVQVPVGCGEEEDYSSPWTWGHTSLLRSSESRVELPPLDLVSYSEMAGDNGVHPREGICFPLGSSIVATEMTRPSGKIQLARLGWISEAVSGKAVAVESEDGVDVGWFMRHAGSRIRTIAVPTPHKRCAHVCACGWVWVHPINSLNRISRRSGADEGHGHGMPKNLNQPAVFEPELGFPYPCCVETEPMSMALVPLDVPAQETWAPPVVDCAGSMDEDRAEPRLSGV